MTKVSEYGSDTALEGKPSIEFFGKERVTATLPVVGAGVCSRAATGMLRAMVDTADILGAVPGDGKVKQDV